MLLKNLDINSAVSNSTTLQILSINHEVLKVKITNSSHIRNIGFDSIRIIIRNEPSSQ